MRSLNDVRLGILYEHPEWFAPLFSELERRRVQYDHIHVGAHSFDPRARTVPYDLVVNRMSPSAYLRGHGHAIFYVRDYLAYLEGLGMPVVNGYEAYSLEVSKARQLALLERLGLRAPRARVINHPSQVPDAARDLAFPVVIKPNIGGSGAKIQRFETGDALEAAARGSTLDLGIDDTALVQEFLPADGGFITRVEVLDGRFLYAIRVYPRLEAGFNLCPADICQTQDGPAAQDAAEVQGSAGTWIGEVTGSGASAQATPRTPPAAFDADLCPADAKPAAGLCPADAAPKMALRVEAASPPPQVIEEVLAIARAARLDVGGVEYLVNARDGQVYYYDINALSNFVANAPEVIGFDPFPQLVDYLLMRAAVAGVPAAA
ncbi:MAG: hypothetical protein HY660_17095 [Armatimonadetes bacterium]|nr:hypothetical protein [Armatimonadota bacterium]